MSIKDRIYAKFQNITRRKLEDYSDTLKQKIIKPKAKEDKPPPAKQARSSSRTLNAFQDQQVVMGSRCFRLSNRKLIKSVRNSVGGYF